MLEPSIMSYLPFFLALSLVALVGFGAEELSREDATNPHRDPSKCEVCKFVAVELQESMAKTGKKKDILQIGHQFDKQQKAIKYHKSELRLIEALDDVCGRILQYNIHAERSASRRFSKGQSETMQTLRGLQAKGVKVDLGIPDDMWEKPSAPVTKMKQLCDQLIEDKEDVISNWFFKTNQETSLMDYLCIQRVLKKDERECLDEVWTGMERVDKDSEPSKPEQPAEETPSPDSTPTPKATTKGKQGTKKPRSRKKTKAGKRGKGKKVRSSGNKAKPAAKNMKPKNQAKSEL